MITSLCQLLDLRRDALPKHATFSSSNVCPKCMQVFKAHIADRPHHLWFIWQNQGLNNKLPSDLNIFLEPNGMKNKIMVINKRVNSKTMDKTQERFHFVCQNIKSTEDLFYFILASKTGFGEHIPRARVTNIRCSNKEAILQASKHQRTNCRVF